MRVGLFVVWYWMLLIVLSAFGSICFLMVALWLLAWLVGLCLLFVIVSARRFGVLF